MTGVEYGSPIKVSVENIGGIDEMDVSFEPGVTVLTGRNATNRTSLLRALMGGLGSDNVSVKGDRDKGQVELHIGDDRYHREFVRTEEGIQSTQESLDCIESADLFAFLLEDNEARRAIEVGDDLHELILRPIDMDALEADIHDVEVEKREVLNRLDELDEAEIELQQLHERSKRLEDELDNRERDLEEKLAEFESFDIGVEQSQSRQEAFEETFDELHRSRRALERTRSDLDIERESIDGLEDQLEQLHAELDELDLDIKGDTADVENRIQELRDDASEVERDLHTLQNLNLHNKKILSGDQPSIMEELADPGELPITEQFLDTDETICWTCGSEVAQDQIEDTVSRIEALADQLRDEHQSVQHEIEELTEVVTSVTARRRQRHELQVKIESIEQELAERSERIPTLEEEEARLREEIDTLESEIDESEYEHSQQVIDLNKEINRIEVDIERITENLDQVREGVTALERQLDEREHLHDRLDTLNDELESLRTHVRSHVEDAVEAFNQHMDEITQHLEFDNLERIWIEHRIASNTQTGPGGYSGEFEVRVVRSAEDGSVYRDSLDHLSESERKVTGLIFALAGYLVYELYEDVPLMLLDSMEAIDAQRISKLVEYFSEYAPYLVVALLPEDAAELTVDHTEISECFT